MIPPHVSVGIMLLAMAVAHCLYAINNPAAATRWLGVCSSFALAVVANVLIGRPTLICPAPAPTARCVLSPECRWGGIARLGDPICPASSQCIDPAALTWDIVAILNAERRVAKQMPDGICFPEIHDFSVEEITAAWCDAGMNDATPCYIAGGAWPTGATSGCALENEAALHFRKGLPA